MPNKPGMKTYLALIASGAAAARWLLRDKPSFFERHVLITGGSRGLGLCMARKLAAEGAHLTLLARDPLELDEARKQLLPFGVPVHTVVCDVGDRTKVQDAVEEAVWVHARLDAIINNAGVIQVGPLHHMREEDFTRALQTHFYGALHVTLAALPFLRDSDRPRVVNITSIGGRVALPHMLPYTVSKFAALGFSQGLHAELAALGIPVTTVVPGLLRTGSHLRALVRGDHAREFEWFALSDTSPAISKDADRAAARILDAARNGQPYVTLTVAAGAAAALSGLFPNVSARVLAAVHRLLPAPVGPEGDESVEGVDTDSALHGSRLTSLGDAAAARNNEV